MGKAMKIYLVLDCLDYGDGVSNDTLSMQEMYREMGYSCEVYTAIYEDKMKYARRDIDQLSCQPGDLLLHHYCGNSRILPIVKRQPCKKVMVYHNITPPEFVEGEVKRDCEAALRQVSSLRGVYDVVVGDSQFNLECLVQLGTLKQGEGEVLPIPVEFTRVYDAKAAIKPRGSEFLFVGRYVPNKKLENIIDVFAYYWEFIDTSAKLKLVGNPKVMPSYTEMLQNKINALPCRSQIELTGKVTDKELRQIYANSDIFLCMSEHEGFCIPVLEAMWHQIPVFAYDAGAVRETMGTGGVVFTEKSPPAVAQLINAVLNTPELLVEIQKRQVKRVEEFSKEKVSLRLKKLTEQWIKPQTVLETPQPEKTPLKVQMQGPFETSYSLAQINRFLIESLHKLGLADVSIHCTEGPGDYTPQEKDLKDKPLARYLWRREKSFGVPDVALRNLFPPVTTGLTAQMNFQSFGWEENRVPQEYVSRFNRDLDGIGTMSDFVTKALLDSGITIPVKTMGIGVRLPENYEQIPPYSLKTKKKIRFLHISSAFPRKGVDVLLETYFANFTATDDVCLILKTFPNIHNLSGEQLNKLRRKYPNGPEVEHIDQDLPEGELYGLYKAASCYVHCARGEGFGLPVAEAMLAGVPTIVCNNSGLADFCREDTCLTVGYTEENAHSHLTENSKWYEPNRKLLGKRMKFFVRHHGDTTLAEMTKKAKEFISTKFTWDAVAGRWMHFIQEVKESKRRPTVDMVTTWNVKCGIAEFTKSYIDHSNQLVDYHVFPDSGRILLRPDEPFVQERVWHISHENDDVSDLIHALKKSTSEIVHVQYNLGFFNIIGLSNLCRELKNQKKVIVLFHATKKIPEQITEENRRRVLDGLNSAFRLVVHQESDAQLLREIGVRNEMIQIIPLGQVVYPHRSIQEARSIMGIKSDHVVGSYGFLLPHKGIEKTIYAIAKLKKKYPDILYIVSCAIYDVDESRNYCDRCLESISRLNLENHVLLFTDFLAPEESAILLQACDLTVMPYDHTNESASGAVRSCMAAKRPLITTKQDIFKEFETCSYQIEGNEPNMIADAIDKMMDPSFAETYRKKMDEHIDQTSWHRVVRDNLRLYMSKKT